MIITDNLDEYVTLSVLKNYCKTYGSDCEDCKITDICDCMPKLPCDFVLKYVEEKKDGK